MTAMILPRLVAGRDLAAAAVRRLGPIDSQRVVVNARPLVAGSASFAAQLVRSVLLDGRAAELVVVGGPNEFVSEVKLAADELGRSQDVRFAVDDDELHAAS